MFDRDALMGRARGLPQAGELLAVEAIDRTGLIVTSEGALVRVFRVTPPNPLLMSAGEREKTAGAFARLVSQLGAEETVQIYIDARPVNLAELLADCRREVQASAGPVPAAADGDRLALARWRLYAGMEESLRLHADAQAAVQVSCYVVVPLVPRQSVARAALAWARRTRLPTASLERPVSAHRRAVREQLAHVDALRAELEAEGMATELLDGERVARLLWARFNPTRADDTRRSAATGNVEVLGELDAAGDRDLARQAAVRLREQIATSSLDFKSSHQHVVVDRDVEQTIVIANTAGRTQMGWLHGAMLTRQPFTLSVFVRGLERRRERQRLKLAYRRLHTINRGAEQRGRVPDFDRYVQEREYRELLGEMATGETSNLFRVSVYQTIRARGPDPDLAGLAEAVDFCTESIESAGDCKVSRGEFRQHELWCSSLPLGRDLYSRGRKYPTANAGDMLPLIGTRCGSPTGVPFAFADPGRTVELINPYDEEHSNHTIVISGRSGSGKTMTASVLLSRCLALGARAFVIDRAGHYETLTRLLDGAQQIEIGSDDSPYALNPWDVPDPAKVSREKIAFLLALHQVMMGGLDARQQGLLGAAVRAVYAKAAALPGQTPRESMLQQELRAQAQEAQDADAVDVAATLRNLADRLSEYCGEGTYAHLLDRATTVPTDAPLVVFDTRRCPESELRLVMFALMEYITGTVERHWKAHRAEASRPGAPLFLGRSMMLIDEAWHLISRPETGAYANNLARRARHLGLVLIVMSQQLSDFDTEHGVALLGNSSQQLLLAQNPKEIPFIADTVQLSEREAAELQRLKTVKGRHAQMLWLNGTRGHGKVALRVGPTEYWAYTSDPTEQAIRETEIARHDGNVWAAVTALAKRGTRAHRDQPVDPPADPMSVSEPAHDGRVDPRRARASLVTVIADERSGASSEPSNGLPPVMSAGLRRGPMLAVCGLCGGAGASTLAYLTALAAARRGQGDVLLADTGGPTAGISHYAGVETPRSLSEVSEMLAASLPVGELLATTPEGLRVLATGPRLAGDCARDGVELLLDHARRRYTLTVIDCGTLARQADQIALAKASHVAWVLPATAGAVDRGRKALDALAPHLSGREMLLARHEPSDRRRALRELRDLARERRAPLILLPALPEITAGNPTTLLETAQVPLQAILGALAR